MAFGNRRDKRVAFMRGLPAQLIAIDGSWQLSCRVIDISQSGAKIVLPQQTETLDLTDFSLRFCASVARRCRVVRVEGGCVGVEFIRAPAKPAAVRKSR